MGSVTTMLIMMTEVDGTRQTGHLRKSCL